MGWAFAAMADQPRSAPAPGPGQQPSMDGILDERLGSIRWDGMGDEMDGWDGMGWEGMARKAHVQNFPCLASVHITSPFLLCLRVCPLLRTVHDGMPCAEERGIPTRGKRVRRVAETTGRTLSHRVSQPEAGGRADRHWHAAANPSLTATGPRAGIALLASLLAFAFLGA